MFGCQVIGHGILCWRPLETLASPVRIAAEPVTVASLGLAADTDIAGAFANLDHRDGTLSWQEFSVCGRNYWTDPDPDLPRRPVDGPLRRPFTKGAERFAVPDTTGNTDGRRQLQKASSASWSEAQTQYSRHNPSERTVKAWASNTSSTRPSSREAVARVNRAVW